MCRTNTRYSARLFTWFVNIGTDMKQLWQYRPMCCCANFHSLTWLKTIDPTPSMRGIVAFGFFHLFYWRAEKPDSSRLSVVNSRCGNHVMPRRVTFSSIGCQGVCREGPGARHSQANVRAWSDGKLVWKSRRQHLSSRLQLACQSPGSQGLTTPSESSQDVAAPGVPSHPGPYLYLQSTSRFQ